MSSYFIPAQKACPSHLPPCTPKSSAFTSRPSLRRRSATVSHIVAWAAQIQPGSPAPLSPHSPFKSPLRRPSISSVHKPSLNGTPRLPSSSFLNLIDTPTTAKSISIAARTPSFSEFKGPIGPTLTQHGYAAVIVQLPTTPLSAPNNRNNFASVPFGIPIPPIPVSPVKSKPHGGLKRLRSLSLRGMSFNSSSKKSSASAPVSSGRSKKPTGSTGLSRYGHLKPLNLGAEVQLSQLLDGGSQETSVKRVMHDAARANGASGVGTAYRTANGEFWWDEDERWEVEDLLGRSQLPGALGKDKKSKMSLLKTKAKPLVKEEEQGNGGWVAFAGESTNGDEERRGSVSSASSPDSDLDPKYVVRAAESIDPARISSRAARSAMMQPQPHLTKVGADLHAFLLGGGNHSDPSLPTSASGAKDRPRGAARRRPAPLTLAPLPNATIQAQVEKPAVKSAMVARRDFLENSFVPPVPAPAHAVAPAALPPPRSSSLTPHASTASSRRPSTSSATPFDPHCNQDHAAFSPTHSRFASSSMWNITRQRTSGSTSTVTPASVAAMGRAIGSTTSLPHGGKASGLKGKGSKKDLKSMFKFGGGRKESNE